MKAFLTSFDTNRDLLLLLIRREILGRYKGSMLGVAWPFLHPLLMLGLYSFVFGHIYQIPHASGVPARTADFALFAFCGLILHGLLAECLSRAPRLIFSQPNFVKKIKFPLQLLPCVTVATALFHGAISFLILLLFQLVLQGGIYSTFLLLPILLLPFCLILLGLCFLLSALGVVFRDLEQIMQPLTSILLFSAPILYPLSIVPEKFQSWLYLNPLTSIVEQTRKIILEGQVPDWSMLGCYMIFSVIWFVICHRVFETMRKGLADAL